MLGKRHTQYLPHTQVDVLLQQWIVRGYTGYRQVDILTSCYIQASDKVKWMRHRSTKASGIR